MAMQVIADAVTVKMSQGQDLDVSGFLQVGVPWGLEAVHLLLSCACFVSGHLSDKLGDLVAWAHKIV